MSVTTREQRRSPNFKRFIITGALLGLLAGFIAAVIGDPAPSYGGGSPLGYLGVMGAALGALLAGLVGVLVDRNH